MRITLQVCLLAFWCLPAQAQDLPPLEYFTGTYELIARQPGVQGEAVLDWVEITQTPKGLALSACRLGEGVLNPLPQPREGQAEFQGRLNEWELFCHFTSDSDNFPRFTCYALPNRTAKVPGLLTLWPVKWKRPNHAHGCKAN